jgi:hypothetical protein
MIRTQGDVWIIGKKSDQREFFVFFEHKNANLNQINGLYRVRTLRCGV